MLYFLRILQTSNGKAVKALANMMDYLIWRGDLTFSQAEFNEVDNLIFSELVYVDFAGIVPGINEKKSISLKEASEIFFTHHTEEEIQEKVCMTKSAAFLMREMAKTKRFSNIMLSDYVEDIDKIEQSQFCAMKIELEDGSIFVSYSGTDETIVGWKENFNMSFLPETPGQLKAVEYLNYVGASDTKSLRVGGHSKGGNLAIYASIHCKKNIQEKIMAVYNNDGPGVSADVLKKEEYHNLLSKIYTIIPESSIVGMILEHEGDYEIVKSSKKGAMQHDPMSWEVEGPSFIYVKSIAEGSILLDKTLRAVMAKMDIRQREEFFDTVFNILEEGEIYTVEDLAKIKWKQFVELWRLRNKLNDEDKDVLSKTFRMLWDESNRTLKERVIKKREKE